MRRIIRKVTIETPIATTARSISRVRRKRMRLPK
jgi:hypothetical protein